MPSNSPDYWKKYYLKHRERLRAVRRRYYLMNQEHLKAYQRDYERREREAKKELYRKVMEWYNGRCVHCMGPAVTLHHLEPKSVTLGANVEANLIPVCNELHTIIHREGTEAWQERLSEYREKALKVLGKSYPNFNQTPPTTDFTDNGTETSSDSRSKKLEPSAPSQ